MFESLALENPRNTRRNWMTAVSFALQATGLSLLVLVPIGYTEAIAPRFQQQIVAPMGMTSVATEPAPQTQERSASGVMSYRETAVTYIEAGHKFHPRAEGGSNTQSFDPNGNYVVGATNSTGGGAMDKLLAEMRPRTGVAPPSTNTRTKPYPISILNPGMLIKQVQPIYPAIAQQTRTEGKVVLVAVIDTQGRIENLRALSGHPFLVPAAINAVQQWRYRPYILNGQPVEVETQITVNFTLQHN
jgi:protein TonB